MLVFANKITDADRNSNEWKTKMAERSEVMKIRKEQQNGKPEKAHNVSMWINEMMALRKEFAEMKEMMKVQRGP